MSVARVLCSSDDTKAYSMLQQCINNQPSLIHSYSNDICLNTKHPRRDDINTFRGHKSVALCVCRFGFWVAMNKPKVVILLSGKRKCGKDFLAGKLLEKCDILESVLWDQWFNGISLGVSDWQRILRKSFEYQSQSRHIGPMRKGSVWKICWVMDRTRRFTARKWLSGAMEFEPKSRDTSVWRPSVEVNCVDFTLHSNE